MGTETVAYDMSAFVVGVLSDEVREERAGVRDAEGTGVEGLAVGGEVRGRGGGS